MGKRKDTKKLKEIETTSKEFEHIKCLSKALEDKKDALREFRYKNSSHGISAYSDVLYTQITKLKKFRKVQKQKMKLSVDLKTLIGHSKLMYDAKSVNLTGKLLAQKIKDMKPEEFMEEWNRLFTNTLSADKINTKLYEEDKKLETDELKEEDVLEALIRTIDKQFHACIELEKIWELTHAEISTIRLDNGKVGVDVIQSLLREEEELFRLLLYDVNIEKDLLNVMGLDVKKLGKTKLEKKLDFGVIYRTFKRVGTSLTVCFIIAKWLAVPPPGHRTHEIVKSIEESLKKPLTELIRDLPAAEQDEIKQKLKEVEKNKKGLDKFYGQWNIAVHDAAKTLSEEFFKQYQDQVKEINETVRTEVGGIRFGEVEVLLTEPEIYEALVKYFNRYKFEILEQYNVNPQSFLDWIIRGGGSPSFTGKSEQWLRQQIMKFLDPKITDLKVELKEKLKLVVLPSLVHALIEAAKFDQKYLTLLVLSVIFGLASVWKIRRIRIIGSIFTFFWPRKTFTDTAKFVAAVIRQVKRAIT